MKDRIKALLLQLGISASEFADKLGVQRSSISHILSGRNNPGLDLLQKILLKYPQISPDWLLIGNGDILRKDIGRYPDQGMNEENEKKISPGEMEIPHQESDVNKIEDLKKLVEVNQRKTLDKIILLYSDGTFSEYHPGSKS